MYEIKVQVFGFTKIIFFNKKLCLSDWKINKIKQKMMRLHSVLKGKAFTPVHFKLELEYVDGKPLDFSTGRKLTNNRGVLATNGPLHDRSLEVLKEVSA